MALAEAVTSILFIGHSLVGPDLPPMLETALAPQNVEVAAQIINGAPLVWNWDHGGEAEGVDGLAYMQRHRVSDLILTEAQPFAGHFVESGTKEMVALWADAARRENPDTRVWLYETWPAFGVEGAEALAAWRAEIRADLPLWQAAAGDTAQVIPAGQAMLALSEALERGEIPGLGGIREIFDDEIHPDHRGDYFVAMVQIASLTGESPEGLPERLLRRLPSRDQAVSPEQALAFQRLAWQVVQDYAQGPERGPQVEPPAVPRHSAITNPKLTLGLAGVHDWSVQLPFLDLFKSARPWLGQLPGQWGGREEADLIAAGVLDPDGWPLFLPDELSGIVTLLLTDLPEDTAGAAGPYLLTYEGKGRLEVSGRAQIISQEAGEIRFDYQPGEGSVVVTLKAIDRVDPIRKIQVVREDRAADLAKGAIFNPDWLARLEGVKGLRFMDWMATNNSTLAKSADRPRPGHYTWARNGVPLEVVMALANQLKAEPWITVPHLAEEDLLREMAAIAARDLDPALRLWVEFSNEVWNWQFTQATWAQERGRALWGVDHAWVQAYALRAAEVMAVFADSMPRARLVRVLATQTGWLGLEADILNAPLSGGPAPKESFDAYAITGYFSGQIGTEVKLGLLREWLALGQDQAIELAAREIRDGSLSGDPTDSVAFMAETVFPYHAKVAADNGLELVMYEGGSHVVGFGPLADDPALTEFFTALNYAPQMGALYREMMAAWAKVTDAPFNAFVDVERPTKWGAWGALRHLGDENPRWQALSEGCAC